MSVIHLTGFEKQDLTDTVEVHSKVGVPTIDTSIKRSGAASLKFPATGSEISVRLESNETADDFVRQYAIYVPTGGLPSGLTKIIQLSDGGGDHTSVRINSNGTLELWDDSGAVQLGSDTPAITLDSFENVIELDVGTTHGGNDAKLKLNGVMVAEGATISAGANHRYSEIGIMGAETATIYFDDCVIVTHANGADFESWPNRIKLVMSLPNAAGDNAATAGLYTSINDNDDADYIEIDTTETPEYNMQSSADIGLPSDALIGFVAVGARVRGETATACSWLPRIKSQASGTTVTGTTTAIASASFNTHDDTAGATRIYKLVSYTDPQGGGSWTPPMWDGAQIGASAPDATPDVWISQMWAYIGYWEKTASMVFRDQFAVSSNTALESKTPDIGTSWTRLASSAGTGASAMAATDRASPAGDLNDGVIYTADATYPSADYAVEFEMCILDAGTSSPQYALVRVQDADNMYAVRINDQGGTNTCQLYKRTTAGGWATLGSAFSPPYNGAICKLEIIGSALKFYIDGVEVASATDTDITAAGKAGLAWGGGTVLVNSGDDMDADNDTDNFTVYNLGSAVSTETIQKSLKYTVLKEIAVTKSLKYTVLTDTAVQKSLTYRVLKENAVTKSLKYTVTTEVAAITKSLKYTIITTPSAVTKSLTYRVLTDTAVTKSLTYIVTSEQSVTKSLKYTVLTDTAVTKSLKYTVLTSDSVTKSLEYRVFIEQPITKSLKYCVLTDSSITKSLTYEVEAAAPVLIQKSLKYTVLTDSSITKSLTYIVTSEQAITKSLKYTVKQAEALTKSLKYTVITDSAITKALTYEILTDIVITKSLNYEVLTSTSITKSLTYRVVTDTAVTKSLTYIVVSEQAVTKSLKYTVFTTPSAVTKSLEYRVLTTDSLTKSLTYHVVVETAITKSLTYRVLKEVAVTKNLTYEVITDTAITKSLTYAIARTFYTREAKASLPANETPLATQYSSQDYLDVATDDAVRVAIEGEGVEFAIHHYRYRHDNDTDDINIHWNGQTELAPTTSTVYLQIYNYTLASWENLDSDNTTGADTDFDLDGSITVGVGDYYDANNHVTIRVYQEGA